MNYSFHYFGKELSDLNYVDIDGYFTIEREESDKIEYKSYYSDDDKNYGEKEKGVIRSISAFLNSDGGIVVWGAPVGQKVEGKKEKVFIGKLSPVFELIEKDRFINKLTDSITPAPNNIKFQRLEKDGKFIYVIEVSKSKYSPHQFKNNYFMRIDGQTRPALHHYIEALFKKITFPHIEGYLSFSNYKLDGSNYKLDLFTFIQNKSEFQNEYELYLTIKVNNGVFNYVSGQSQNIKITYGSGQRQIYIIGLKEILYFNEPVLFPLSIIYNPYEVQKSNYETIVELYFAGKLSPLKRSVYKLKLTKPVHNPNNNIIDIKENTFIAEENNNSKISESDKLKKILNRNF